MDSVKLVRALASLTGANNVFQTDPAVERLKEKIGKYDHYLFILLDGFGDYFLGPQTEYTFFKDKRVQSLRSVFPSTTASALTSLSTGLYPCQHGAIGWWTYLAEYEKTSVYLPFMDRMTGAKLSDISPEKMYYAKSFYSEIKRRTMCYVPSFYVNSEFSTLSRAHRSGTGYKEFEEALNLSAEFALKEPTSSFQYLYYPEIDSLEHGEGVSSLKVKEKIFEVQRLLKDFYEKHKGKIRVVISADHGLMDIPSENNLFIGKDHPLMKFLKIPPACETRVPMFFLKDHNESQQFFISFNEFFSQQFVLLSKNEVVQKKLLGSDPWHPLALGRLGDFIALPKGPWTLQYHDEKIKALILKACHGALSPEETQVPLILF